MEALILTTVNTHLLPAFNQHGFRAGHTTTSALLQLTSDVATGFNQRIKITITYCYKILQDQRFLRQHVDGYRTTSEVDQLQAAEGSSRRQE